MAWDTLRDSLPYLLVGAYPEGPLGGMALTLLLSVGSALLAAALGLAWGIGLVMARGELLRGLHGAVALLRAIPVLMLIFWTYFLLPYALGIDVPGMLSVVCALSLVGGAYLGHGVAAGIRAIPPGQWAAGLALGLTRWQTLRWVVLPPALRIMQPSFVNQWVTLTKDSSLAYVVGVPELSFVAAQVNARTMIYPAEIFVAVGLLYWLLCSALAWGAQRWLARSPAGA